MTVGTKSLLFGVHQVFWHPFTVLRAWIHLYGWPSWRELVCIAIHDLGYWGSPNMDGPEGELHPYEGAALAGWLFGPKYHDFVLLHSRYLAKKLGREPSRLCWADKFSMLYEWRWFYLCRARCSGEILEYRRKAAERGFLVLSASDQDWHRKLTRFLRGLVICEVAKEEQAALRAGRIVYRGREYSGIELPPIGDRYHGCAFLVDDSGRRPVLEVVYPPQLHLMEWRRRR